MWCLALVATLPLLIVSCEEVLDVDENQLEQHLVLNAMPSNGNRVFINFTTARFFLDDYNHPLSDAQLTLYVNHVPLSPDSVSGCNYFFGYTATAGDSLEVRATGAGLSASASTYVPAMSVVNNVSARLDSTLFRMVMIKFRLDDAADLKQMYHINVVERDSGLHYNSFTKTFDTIDTVYNPYFMCFDPLVTDPSVRGMEPMGGYFYERLLCSDELIDGRGYNITLMVLKLVDTNEVEPYIHDYSLSVESVTPERYDYLQQVARAQSSTSLFAEPSQVTGNVHGALGVFAGTAKQLIHLSIDGSTSSTMPTIPADPEAVLREARKLGIE